MTARNELQRLTSAEQLPCITASRVALRWVTDQDIDDLFSVFSDREVMRYWSWPVFRDRAEAGRLVVEIHDLFRRGTLFQWGVARKEDDRIIGSCTLAQIDVANRRAEIGFVLGRPHWGRGLMGEALEALLGFAFDELKLQRIEADVDPDNAPSIRLLVRLGFQQEGRLRERWRVGGQVRDSLFYGLLRREWEASRP